MELCYISINMIRFKSWSPGLWSEYYHNTTRHHNPQEGDLKLHLKSRYDVTRIHVE